MNSLISTLALCAAAATVPICAVAQGSRPEDIERKRYEPAGVQQRDEQDRLKAFYERERVKQQEREEQRLREKAEYETFVKQQEHDAAERVRIKRERDEADRLIFQAQQAKMQAELDAAYAVEVRREQAGAARVASAEKAMKERCAGDYRNPQIGMGIDRWKECVSTLRMTGQVNRPDGIANLYRGAGYWVNVMGGRVVAWGR